MVFSQAYKSQVGQPDAKLAMGLLLWISNFVRARTPNYRGTFAVFRVFMLICGVNFFDEDFMVGPVNMFRFLGPMLTGYYSLVACFIHLIRYLGDTDITILSLDALFSAFEVLIKVGGMALKRKLGARLMKTILEDRSYEDGEIERFTFLKYHTLARKLMYITIISYPFTALMLLSYPVLAGKLDEYVLPVGYSIPFINYKQHPWYTINYLITIAQMAWCALAFIGCDGPFYLYVCYSSCKLEILKSYTEKIGETNDIEEQRTLMRKIIKIHTQVLDSHLRFAVPCSAALTVCSQPTWPRCGSFVTVVVTKSNELSEAMYTNRWYQLWSKKDLKAVQFMLANAYRNVGFSIGGFGFLSYDAFAEIMKTAYSCNAFLHNMMN
ncbi:AAEL002479-PA [Aedes aegypti]|uniref:Odorant receptor n=1 Tax=Aedes aegypti TaxID=7159 RepID=Q17I21_AEDAE|nr:AAEL002479-PA [Aedes aegypti]